jgi:uncharacterized membrane protein
MFVSCPAWGQGAGLEVSDPHSFSAIGWILVSLAALATAANSVMKLVDRLKDKPPAVEVRAEAAERFVHKETCRENMGENARDHRDLFGRIGGVERGAMARVDAISKEWRAFVDMKLGELMQSNNEGRERMHVRMNTFEKSIGALEAETRLQNQQLAQIRSAMDRLAERVGT